MLKFKGFIIHSDLRAIKSTVYKRCSFKTSKVIIEKESAEYGAAWFKLNNLMVRFRAGKTTPAKAGQFVVLWKRIDQGEIQPYDAADDLDFFVISCRKNSRFGTFVFPKDVLIKRGILSVDGQGGKLGTRVYSPWSNPVSAQAKKTQRWQLKYFLEIPVDGSFDCARANMLYSKK